MKLKAARTGMPADSAKDPEPPEATRIARPPEDVARSLAFMFKHARLRLGGFTHQALAPFGIEGRELAVLIVLASDRLSQQEAAGRLGVDRTTMVTLLDGLETKSLVARHPHAQDRRRNLVELTAAGQAVLGSARRASGEAEARFLARLSAADAGRFREALMALAEEPATGEPSTSTAEE
jgi:DNA-binding MarR family transcriptional regulator